MIPTFTLPSFAIPSPKFWPDCWSVICLLLHTRSIRDCGEYTGQQVFFSPVLRRVSQPCDHQVERRHNIQTTRRETTESKRVSRCAWPKHAIRVHPKGIAIAGIQLLRTLSGFFNPPVGNDLFVLPFSIMRHQISETR